WSRANNNRLLRNTAKTTTDKPNKLRALVGLAKLAFSILEFLTVVFTALCRTRLASLGAEICLGDKNWPTKKRFCTQ
ncbi:hypothetical protein MHN32_23145, partial [Pseudoalteromonas sp. Of11M-6]